MNPDRPSNAAQVSIGCPITPMSPMRHALKLAEAGFAVLPCLPNKAPACIHGHKDATRDPRAIRTLFEHRPYALVGVATGAVSDLAVLDIDAKHPEASMWWTKHRDLLLPTWVVRTRSGGLHLWYRHVPGLRCSAGLIAPGIDVRADGGYIIAWQVAGFPVLCGAARASWPQWLPTHSKTVPRRHEQIRVPDDRKVTALIRFVALAPETQRNNRLYWAACRMARIVASGLMDAGIGEALLVSAAIHAGLSESEARSTARSGLTTRRAD